MTTLNDLKELLFKRRDAEATLDDPGIAAAFLSVREKAIEEFTTSRPDQSQEREDAYQRLRALALVRQELAQAVADHEFAQSVVDKTTTSQQ